MRESAFWKIVICLAAVVALPVYAQETAPRIGPSTPDQLALLDEIKGVGPLKFGADISSFDRNALKATDDPNAAPSATTHFIYTPPTQITWGNLVPTEIDLQFFYNELIGIRLRFNDTNGTLIPVYRAVLEKYGNTSGRNAIQFNDWSYEALQWATPKMSLTVSLPQTIPPQATDDFLNQKTKGAVEVFDTGLRDKLTHEKLEGLRDQLLKSQDLDKIKGDL